MSQLTKQQLKGENQTQFPNNNVGAITPSNLRAFNVDMIDSTVNQTDFTNFSGSVAGQFASITASVDTGSLVSTASFNTYTQSNDLAVDALESSASLALITASFSGNTLSFTKGNGTTFGIVIPDVSGSTINTGSLVTTASFNAYTQSNDAIVNALVAATSSYLTETESGSFLITASFNNGNRNLTFTKGNASTFDINIPASSIDTASFATTGSNTFRGTQTLVSSSIQLQGSGQITLPNGFSLSGNATDITQLSSQTSVQFITEPPAGPGGANDIKFINRVSGSQIVFDNQQGGAGNNITFAGGDILFNVVAVSGSSQKVRFGNNISNSPTSIDATNSTFTASLQQGFTYVGNAAGVTVAVPTSSFAINTASFATTGSNTFNGNQTINGTVSISSSATNDLVVNGRIFVSSSSTSGTGTPQITVSGSGGQVIIGRGGITSEQPGANPQQSFFNPLYFGSLNTSNFNEIGIAVNAAAALIANWPTGSAIYVNDPTDSYPAMFGFQNKTTWTDGRITALRTLIVSGALDVQTTLTASLAQGLMYVGNSSGRTGAIPTASFATTGSNTFNGNQIISGAVFISSSAASDLVVNGQIFVSSSATGGTTAPLITISGSQGTTLLQRNVISTQNLTTNAQLSPFYVMTSNLSTFDEIGLSIDPVGGGIAGWSTGPVLYTNNPTDTYPAALGFQNKANWTDGRITSLRPLVVSGSLNVSGSSTLRGNTTITGSLTLSSSAAVELNVIGGTTLSGSLYIQTSSLFPQGTGSELLSWDASTGQVRHTTYASALPVLMAVGAFYSTGSITTTANTSGSFVFDTSLNVNSVVLNGSGSHIIVDRSGTYNFQYSVQIDNGANAADVAIWLKKNGANVPDTATILTVASNHKDVLALNLWDTATAGDYYEIAYQSTTSNTSFSTIAASGNIPRSPAIILTVNQVR